MNSQLPLFGEPQEPAPPPARHKSKGTWSRYRGRRLLCWACVHLIHELGVGVAPLPRAATYRLRTDDEVHFYCTAHHDQIRGNG